MEMFRFVLRDLRSAHRHLSIFLVVRRIQTSRAAFAHGGFQDYLHDCISVQQLREKGKP
jgi:hypothetical protein